MGGGGGGRERMNEGDENIRSKRKVKVEMPARTTTHSPLRYEVTLTVRLRCCERSRAKG